MAEENVNGCSGCSEDSSSCGGDCGSCGGSCGSEPQSFIKPFNQYSSVKKVIGIVSGKGGVGKSFVTASMAVQLARKGFKVGILDADITGPSIPKMFGIKDKAQGDGENIFPIETKELGIKIISVNMLLEDETKPVIWRGPVIAGVVEQFWTDVMWGELDYLLIDMPPGTGDVPLTVFQSIPVTGIVIVTSPQDLVKLIVEKAYNMAITMDIPVLGMVENYSYFECPDCGIKHHIYGESKAAEIAAHYGIDLLGQIPIVPEMAELVDAGLFEKIEHNYIDKAIDKVKIY